MCVCYVFVVYVVCVYEEVLFVGLCGCEWCEFMLVCLVCVCCDCAVGVSVWYLCLCVGLFVVRVCIVYLWCECGDCAFYLCVMCVYISSVVLMCDNSKLFVWCVGVLCCVVFVLCGVFL